MSVFVQVSNDCVIDILKVSYFLEKKTDAGISYTIVKFNDPAGNSLDVYSPIKDIFSKIKKVLHSPKFKIAFPDIASRFELMEITDETD